MLEYRVHARRIDAHGNEPRRRMPGLSWIPTSMDARATAPSGWLLEPAAVARKWRSRAASPQSWAA